MASFAIHLLIHVLSNPLQASFVSVCSADHHLLYCVINFLYLLLLHGHLIVFPGRQGRARLGNIPLLRDFAWALLLPKHARIIIQVKDAKLGEVGQLLSFRGSSSPNLIVGLSLCSGHFLCLRVLK